MVPEVKIVGNDIEIRLMPVDGLDTADGKDYTVPAARYTPELKEFAVAMLKDHIQDMMSRYIIMELLKMTPDDMERELEEYLAEMLEWGESERHRYGLNLSVDAYKSYREMKRTEDAIKQL